jgi:hypothetical protein
MGDGGQARHGQGATFWKNFTYEDSGGTEPSEPSNTPRAGAYFPLKIAPQGKGWAFPNVRYDRFERNAGFLNSVFLIRGWLQFCVDQLQAFDGHIRALCPGDIRGHQLSGGYRSLKLVGLIVSSSREALGFAPQADGGERQHERKNASEQHGKGSERSVVNIGPVADAASPATEEDKERGQTLVILLCGGLALCGVYAAFERARRPNRDHKEGGNNENRD